MNIFCLAGRMVSIATLFIVCKNSHRQYVNRHGCVLIKLYSQKEGTMGWIWPVGCSLLTPATDHRLEIQEIAWDVY